MTENSSEREPLPIAPPWTPEPTCHTGRTIPAPELRASTMLTQSGNQGGAMQDWDDDADYHAAVGRTWLTVVIALACAAVVACIALAGALGFFGLTDTVSLIAD
ncbi:hypothetical protein [Streptomyces kronopolitis]